MKRILLVVLFFASVGAFAQGTVTGKVVDADLQAGLPGANVKIKGGSKGTVTDFDGNFTLSTDQESGTVVISYVGFTRLELPFNLTNGTADLGTITLLPDAEALSEVIVVGSGVIDLAESRRTPVAVSTITKAEIEQRAVGNVEITEALKNSPSIYVANQTGFGDGTLFVRGFDDTNTAILLNGQPVNGQEDGRVYWSNWAGIADIANGIQVQRGLGSSKLAISSVGGTVNIIMKAADKAEGGFARFLGGNDSYFKGTLAYDSGKNESGWAFSVLVDHWQAHRKWAEGTFGQGQNYYAAVGYEPNEDHQFNFLITGAPQSHGQRWSQSKERIAANEKYNQHWGFTEDLNEDFYSSEIESERANYYHKPVANLNWDWNISDNSDLSTVLYASWGRGGSIGPRGDGRQRTTDPDGDGPLRGQIDFFGIEQNNLTAPNGIATGGDDGEYYIRRNSVNNHQWYGLISNFNTDLTEKISFNVGTDLRLYRGDHFRQITDFHGLQGWADDRPDDGIITEAFESNPWSALFDFADEDQRIDYDYSENINYQGVFSQIEYASDKFSTFFQGALSNQSFQRDGRMRDPGKSDKLNIIGYNLKGGLGYTIDNTHTLFANAGFYSRQPFLDNIFQNIRVSNELVEPEVENEDILGVEGGYRIKTDNFVANLNAYYTSWDNRTLLSGGTEDVNGTPDNPDDDRNLNFFDRGVKQLHRGVELEMMYRAASIINLQGFISAGSWQYDSQATRSVYDDDTNELIRVEEGVDVSGVKITTAPQFTAGLSTRINATDNLMFNANINYYGEHYLNEFFNNGLQTENIGKVKPFSLTDVGMSYDFNFDGSKLIFRANAFNIFDEVRVQQTDNFGFIFTNGVTYNASLSYTF